MTSEMDFETLLKADSHPPLVFQQTMDNWQARQWTVKHLAKLTEGKQFQCKISPTDHEDVMMETECLHIQCSLQQYDDWLSQQPREDNPLSMFDPATYSCYIDYKYMKDMFSDKPELLKELSWERFGFPGRDGTQSTIWIGSAGAYTPCHQDTYGFNLVAQITGRKRWYLFPPTAINHMYPTRVPFEESSIFSEINVRNPNFRKHPQFQGAEPHIVVLEPGQVLYVPRHWWHFVECLEPCISINTWVEMKEDIHSHLQEAVTRFLFTSMAGLVPSSNFVNTYEYLESPDVSVQYIHQALENHLIETEDLHLEDKAHTESESAGSSACLHAAQPCSSLATTHTDNLVKFSTAFKNHIVKLSERHSNDVYSKSSWKGRKRHSNILPVDEKSSSDQILKEHNSCTCSKVPKLEPVIMCKRKGSDGSDGDSVNTNGVAMKKDQTVESLEETVNATTDRGDKESSSFKGDSDVVKICTVPKLTHRDYLDFLRTEFEYDENEYKFDSNERSVDSKRGSVDSKECRRQDEKLDRLIVDVINSVLDHNIISLISQNLLKKFKD